MKTADINRIIDDLGERLARDIDTEVAMTALGWVAFEFSEGTVYGQKYLTVHPTSGARWDAMMKWMIDTFGPSGTKDKPMVWTPDQRWYANNAKFWFRDKQDLEWFVLKWS